MNSWNFKEAGNWKFELLVIFRIWDVENVFWGKCAVEELEQFWTCCNISRIHDFPMLDSPNCGSPSIIASHIPEIPRSDIPTILNSEVAHFTKSQNPQFPNSEIHKFWEFQVFHIWISIQQNVSNQVPKLLKTYWPKILDCRNENSQACWQAFVSAEIGTSAETKTCEHVWKFRIFTTV